LNIKAPKLDGAPRGDRYCYAVEIAVSSVLGLVVAAVGVWWICIGDRSSRNPQLGKERWGNRKDGTMSRDGYTELTDKQGISEVEGARMTFELSANG
jgi:hypothetical protein